MAAFQGAENMDWEETSVDMAQQGIELMDWS
jgi:hypothetical protein